MRNVALGFCAAVVTLAALAAATSISASQSGGVATVIPLSDIEATVAAAPAGRVSDQQIRHVEAAGDNVGVGIVHRPATDTGSAIQHDKQTEVYRILEGSGMLVTGGSLIGSRPLSPEGVTVRRLTGPSSIGSGIDGGESRRVSAGDMVIIPAGVPHGFSSISEAITYLVVRIDPEQLVELK